MKKIIVCVTMLLSVALSYSQQNFIWDQVDSIGKTKNQLYSDCKLIIAETWKSAKDVIQNDDKDGGMIIVKGLTTQSKTFQMNLHTWTFAYTVKFMIKDQKYRIVIEDVYCESARCAQYEWPHMPVARYYPNEKGMKITGVNEERYLEIMASLKQDLQNLFDEINSKIKSKSQNSEW